MDSELQALYAELERVVRSDEGDELAADTVNTALVALDAYRAAHQPAAPTCANCRHGREHVPGVPGLIICEGPHPYRARVASFTCEGWEGMV